MILPSFLTPSENPAWPRSTVLAGVVLLSLCLITYLSSVLLTAPCFGWNDLRLTPTVYFFQSEASLYGSLPRQALSVLYGPMTFFAYAPAALASSAESVIRIGTCCALFWWLISTMLPFYLVFRAESLALSKTVLLLLALAGLSASLVSPILNYGLAAPHADAPGLALLIVAALTTVWRPRYGVWITALAGGLAVSCKITYALPVIAIFIWVLFYDGCAAAVRLALAGMTTAVLLAFLWASIFGLGPLCDAVLTVPASHPWNLYSEIGGSVKGTYDTPMGKALCLSQGLLLVCLRLMPWLLIGLLVAAFTRLYPADDQNKASKLSAVTDRWHSMCLLLALFGIVPAALGLAKSGGDLNTLAVCFVFAFHLVFLHLVRIALRLRSSAILSSLFVFSILLMSTRMINLAAIHFMRHDSHVYEKLGQTLKQAPDQVWLPTRPLAHWFEEGKVCHSGDVLYCYALGHMSLDQQWLATHLPEKLDRIVGYKFDPWISLGFANLFPPTFPAPTPLPQVTSGLVEFPFSRQSLIQNLTGTANDSQP